jgi:glycosyltransferase 2 family protein
LSCAFQVVSDVAAPPVERAPGRAGWKRLVRAAVSAAILGGLAWRLDWGQVAAAFRGMRWELWLASVGLFLATQVVSAVRWQWLARPLGFDEPLGRFVAYYFVGMFFNLLLPTSVGGDVVRAVYLNAVSERRTAALLSVLLDRLSGLLVLLALACAAALAYPLPLPLWVAVAVGGAAGGAVTSLAVLPASTRFLARLKVRGSSRGDKLLTKIRTVAASLREALRVYRRRPRLVVASALLSVLVQLAGVAQVWLIGRALGLEVPVGVYGVAVPMVALLTLLPVSVSGMGVREAGMVLFLQPAGVAAGPAVTVAFLWFCVQTAGGLAGAGVYLFGRFARPEVRHDDALGDRPGQGRAGQPRAAA